MSQPDDRAMFNTLAGMLEQIATQLENIMPKLRTARESWSRVAAKVAEHAGLDLPPDQADMLGAEELGFGRVEAARARIAAAVHEVEDELPRP